MCEPAKCTVVVTYVHSLRLMVLCVLIMSYSAFPDELFKLSVKLARILKVFKQFLGSSVDHGMLMLAFLGLDWKRKRRKISQNGIPRLVTRLADTEHFNYQYLTFILSVMYMHDAIA